MKFKNIQNNLPILVLGEGVNEPLPLSLDTLKIKNNTNYLKLCIHLGIANIY